MAGGDFESIVQWWGHLVQVRCGEFTHDDHSVIKDVEGAALAPAGPFLSVRRPSWCHNHGK